MSADSTAGHDNTPLNRLAELRDILAVMEARDMLALNREGQRGAIEIISAALARVRALEAVTQAARPFASNEFAEPGQIEGWYLRLVSALAVVDGGGTDGHG